MAMVQFRLLVRLSSSKTTYTIVVAPDAFAAKLLGEALYGKGNVLNYARVKS